MVLDVPRGEVGAAETKGVVGSNKANAQNRIMILVCILQLVLSEGGIAQVLGERNVPVRLGFITGIRAGRK